MVVIQKHKQKHEQVALHHPSLAKNTQAGSKEAQWERKHTELPSRSTNML